MSRNNKSLKFFHNAVAAVLCIILPTSCTGGTEHTSSLQIRENKIVIREDVPMEAQVRTVNGVPRLFLNDQSVAPTMFSYIANQKNPEAIYRQIELAGQYGTPIVRISMGVQSTTAAGMKAFVDPVIDTALEHNPDALIMIAYSVYVPPSTLPSGAEFNELTNSTGEKGSSCSLTSDEWVAAYAEGTRALVEYIQSQPRYACRVIGYQPCAGSAGEWFGPMYWEGWTDCSDANTMGFRAFLREKYKDDAALRSAWGSSVIAIDSVEIPDAIPGSGLDAGKKNPLTSTLILMAENQKYSDYEDYYSAKLADAIITFCNAVKEASGGKSLTMVYSGYHSEVRTPFAGNFAMYKLLDVDCIDTFSGPVSYNDRNEGGIGAFMSPVSSIHAAGKIWFDECDYRTVYKTSEGFTPGGTQESVNYQEEIQTVEGTIGVLQREMGKSMVYGSGAYWLDLIYKGWFDSEDFWTEHRKLQTLYQNYASVKTGKGPDVAIVYDEWAMNILGQPWQIGSDLLADTRVLLNTAGYSFGYYSTDDVIEGRIDDAKIYYMLTPWRMSQAQMAALEKKFFSSGKTVVWTYGYGLSKKSAFERLVGMKINENRASMACDIFFNSSLPKGLEALKSQFFTARDLQPWYSAVSDKKSETLAVYDGTKNAAVAMTNKNGYNSIFYGTTLIAENIYKTLNSFAKAHAFSTTNDSVAADDGLVTFHAKNAGEKTVYFPQKCDVYFYGTGKWKKNVNRVTFSMKMGETELLFYGKQKQMKEFIK